MFVVDPLHGFPAVRNPYMPGVRLAQFQLAAAIRVRENLEQREEPIDPEVIRFRNWVDELEATLTDAVLDEFVQEFPA